MRLLPFLLLLTVPLGPALAGELPPAGEDWLARGIAIPEGVPGDWDDLIVGLGPCAVLQRDGTTFLYYLGADGLRASDGEERHRALGVATSPDGLVFQKHPGNPVVTFSPGGDEEEGVFSCAAVEDEETGEIVMYYGALRAVPPAGSVDVEIRMRVSSDGLAFTDDTLIRRVPGAEIEPVGAFRGPDGWNLYYVESQPANWRLRLLSGPARDDLPTSQDVPVGPAQVRGLSLVPLDDGRRVAFLRRDPEVLVQEVRIVDPATPAVPGPPLSATAFPDLVNETLRVDRTRGTWYRYAAVAGGVLEVADIAAYTAPLLISQVLQGFEGMSGPLPPGFGVIGRATVESSASFGGYSEPSEGEKFLYLRSGPGAAGEPGLGVDATGDGGIEIDDSSVGFLVRAPGPGMLQLDLDILTSEVTRGFPDPLALVLDGGFAFRASIGAPNGTFPPLAAALVGPSMQGPDGSTFVDGHTGYQTLAFPVASGQHSLLFYVADETDELGDTAFLIDNVRFVPEPGWLPLCGASALGIAALRRAHVARRRIS